ncbi:MAG: hypothetical protein QM652_14315, partial [Legionella sp.]|uniref:polysaccharide pyruvyl transferase family protein n=1 Tax=Legionella sp. TaxID=459 RepID=UPI0039E624E2
MNIYEVFRESDQSYLSKIDNELIMVKNKAPNCFIGSFDKKLGVLFTLNHLVDVVFIEENESGFSFKSIERKKYFTSKPLKDDVLSNRFVCNRQFKSEWEKFDLKEEGNLKLSPLFYEEILKALLHNIIYKREVINLKWWRGKDFTNLGDELNPYVVSFVSNKQVEYVEDIKDTDILGIGSILEWPAKRDRVYEVWGSGTLAPQLLDESKYKINLLRGPLTQSLLPSINKVVPYGDPGILCSKIWPMQKTNKYDWGLIIHHSQYNLEWVQRIISSTKSILFIDLKNPNLKEIMQQINSCKHIASTSLHGLIIADSYN